MYVKFNKRFNRIMEHSYEPDLQDVAAPELYRPIFQYGSVPRITFNNRIVPLNTPEEIFITDTTFRDGQQACSPFTTENIVEIFKLLHKLGGAKGIIRQSEFFLYTENDRLAVEKCRELNYRFPIITSWIRANEKDFELVKRYELKETGILTSCSDYHIFKKMNMTRRQALDKYLGIVKSALSKGITPRCHFEDITRADFFGFVVPFAIELMRLSKESGIPVKIRCCDTMGYGITYPGSSMPRSVQGIVFGLMYQADVPSEFLEWHGHNDFYKAVVNSVTAWLYGSASVNTTCLGIGERTGNTPLEAMAIEYAAVKGKTDGMDLTAITEIAEYFENVIGYTIPPRTPFVGKDFNVTRAGIHADGLMKDQEIYNIFDTAKLLNRPPRVLIDSFSGLAGIAYWLNDYFEVSDPAAKIAKNHPTVAAMKAEIDKKYESGRTTVMSDVELIALFKAADAGKYAEFCAFSRKAK
ncbi:MAG: 2-isopropylmalate synthase [Clostridiaceae bacterium]|jgi:isopropylmalate/homocitrate/citramalate synthase|nr:2-isopropylmalate synthase [Clostridiaceae bacterium]